MRHYHSLKDVFPVLWEIKRSLMLEKTWEFMSWDADIHKSGKQVVITQLAYLM